MWDISTLHSPKRHRTEDMELIVDDQSRSAKELKVISAILLANSFAKHTSWLVPLWWQDWF